VPVCILLPLPRHLCRLLTAESVGLVADEHHDQVRVALVLGLQLLAPVVDLLQSLRALDVWKSEAATRNVRGLLSSNRFKHE
jgi:hypothetical protein